MNDVTFASSAASPVPGESGFLVIPAGGFRANDGRPREVEKWFLTVAGTRAVIQKLRADRRPMLVDYEHQTLSSTQTGLPAPAAGWIGNLEWREGLGLFATNVDWTKRARAYLAAREYRYVSPVFTYSPSTGEIHELRHVALTNTPALTQLPEVLKQVAARSLTYVSPAEASRLTPEGFAVCKAMHIDPLDYMQTKAAEYAQRGAPSARLSDLEYSVCESFGITPSDYLAEKGLPL